MNLPPKCIGIYERIVFMRVEMKGICKSFGNNAVLKNAAISISDGEIHALMGENGAGKSTLMKILTGVYSMDKGEIFIDGNNIAYNHPRQAENAGIVFIYQELNSINDLTVEENLFLGKEISNKLGILDKKAMREKTEDILKKLGVNISAATLMRDLSVGQQQMIEIAKALMNEAKLIIMDEPTAALTPSETDFLFDIIRRLKKAGVSMVYISHRMEEIFELCDRITILRDGEYIATKNISDTDMNDVVKMMIGREIGERFPKRKNKISDIAIRVDRLSKQGMFDDISFDVRAGEVLGVAGLMGSGRTEIMHTIFGSIKADRGAVIINKKAVNIRSARDAKKQKIAFITEDRKTEGLLTDKSIKDNISLANLESISKFGIISSKLEKWLADKGVAELNIKCFDTQHLCGQLSGGNQQKVIFAKWMFTNPRILILDEPTRGVDIGAKKEIYNIINTLAERGTAIIMVSSELPEVIGMSDRVMVIHEGKVGGILPADKASQENIMILATGGSINE